MKVALLNISGKYALKSDFSFAKRSFGWNCIEREKIVDYIINYI